MAATRTASLRLLALTLLLMLAGIGGAWFSELVLGYTPCKLCLWQRWPYYLGVPVALVGALLAIGPSHDRPVRVLATLVAVIFLGSMALAVYHAGVEWRLWLGPSDCGGRIETNAPSLEAFRQSLERVRVVPCDEAPLRVLGLSFAGWNVLVSLAIAVLAGRTALAGPR